MQIVCTFSKIKKSGSVTRGQLDQNGQLVQPTTQMFDHVEKSASLTICHRYYQDSLPVFPTLVGLSINEGL